MAGEQRVDQLQRLAGELRALRIAMTAALGAVIATR
jgi:hypothetical protein